MLPADVIGALQNFVNTVFLVYLILIILYILTSWLPLPYNVWLNRFQRFLYDVVEPYLRLFRRFLPQLRLGAFDLTPIIAIFALYALNALIQAGLGLLR